MAIAMPAAPPCPRCGAPNYKASLFCDSCRVYIRDDTQTVERVTYNRRFWGDVVLEGFLVVITLVIGWLIWFVFTSQTGQTPAKRLLNVYPIGAQTGRVIGRGDAWIREIVKFVFRLVSLVWLLDAIWVLVDKDRQALHDKVLSQLVIYAPAGIPASMQQMQNAPPIYQAPPFIPGQASAPVGPPPVQDIGEELRELNRLKSEGLITEEEFEQKRQALISRM